MKKPIAYILLGMIAVGTLVIAVGQMSSSTTETRPVTIPADLKEITMYKSPSCGCCDGHAEAYREMGFSVSVVEDSGLQAIKEKHGIPYDKQSCHTVEMGDYFIEGHVPMEVIARLVKEEPDIEGILLPGMPTGTPGMPGPKSRTYDILQKEGNTFKTYMEV